MVKRSLKPVLSPSGLGTLKFCPRLWHWRYIDKLDLIRELNYLMLFGGMYHALTEGIDKGTGPVGALDKKAEEYRLHPTYLARDSALIDHCRKEMVDDMLPGYTKFLRSGTDDDLYVFGAVVPAECTILAVEETLEVEFDTFILKVIPDKVIETAEGEAWVIERKTTQRDDTTWHRQWAMNLQTTCETIAVEQTLGRPVSGVLLEQVVVTRKRSKNWPYAPLPQPIANKTWHPWRPVPKPQHIKDQTLDFIRGCVKEIEWRTENGLSFQPNLGNCPMCRMHGICKGSADPQEALVSIAR